MKWIVYCHVHDATGRRYVGLTKMTVLRRWNRHIYNSNQTSGKKLVTSYFANAIRLHGKDAFTHHVLGVFDNLEDANNFEKAKILEFDSRNPEKGFNLAEGGAHVPHPIKNPWDRPGYRERNMAASKAALNTPESKARRSAISRKIWASPELRFELSQTLQKIAKTPENRSKRSLASKGRKLSLEHREKIRTSSKSGSPEVRAKILASMSTLESKAKRSAISKEIRSRPEVIAKMKARTPKTHCKSGHSLDDAYVWRNNRICRACRKLRRYV